ncbi:Pleiotropic regulator 1 [Homalodisca vitripennis]|nr:Pleiotropic regulator 1 [Homalodisca vitripennis]
MTEEVQRHSVHTLVFRSLKRTHDMFLSSQGQLPPIDEFAKWHKACKEGQNEITDEPHSGCLITARTVENIQRVPEILSSDH